MIVALAARGEACIHSLTLDGKPVSMQLVLRAGPAAFTWKTAYDEAERDFSPGMLLLEDYTAAFLADPGISHVDSCAYDETSFMGAWSERQAIATLWFDATPGGSAAFTLLTRLQRAYLRARGAAKAALSDHMSKGARAETDDPNWRSSVLGDDRCVPQTWQLLAAALRDRFQPRCWGVPGSTPW